MAGMEQEILQVESEILQVVLDIKKVEEDIKKVEGDIENATNNEDKKRLWKKEEQLRDKEVLLLRDKERQLMKKEGQSQLMATTGKLSPPGPSSDIFFHEQNINPWTFINLNHCLGLYAGSILLGPLCPSPPKS